MRSAFEDNDPGAALTLLSALWHNFDEAERIYKSIQVGLLDVGQFGQFDPGLFQCPVKISDAIGIVIGD